MKKCTNCSNCLQVDFGYSNYTVEGTSVYCIRNKHPNAPFDRWYGEEPKLSFAENCELFSEGKSGVLDCDRELFKELEEKFQKYIEEGGV